VSASIDQLLSELLKIVPELEPAAAQERAWLASGEALPGTDPSAWTLAEIARGLFVRLRDGDATAALIIVALADVLENWHDTGHAIDTVIDDVLVYYPNPGEDHDEVTRALGPRLRSALDAQRDIRLSPAVEAFVDGLLRAVPALHPLADDCRYGYHDAVVAHAFLGEVVHREIALLTGGTSLDMADDDTADRAEQERLYLAGAPDPAAEIRAVIDYVEAALGSDEEVNGLIRVSFVENLPYPGEPGEEIIALLGPRLTAALRQSRGAMG